MPHKRHWRGGQGVSIRPRDRWTFGGQFSSEVRVGQRLHGNSPHAMSGASSGSTGALRRALWAQGRLISSAESDQARAPLVGPHGRDCCTGKPWRGTSGADPAAMSRMVCGAMSIACPMGAPSSSHTGDSAEIGTASTSCVLYFGRPETLQAPALPMRLTRYRFLLHVPIC
jgi:hypothetical protein